jgi:hypothetical protein
MQIKNMLFMMKILSLFLLFLITPFVAYASQLEYPVVCVEGDEPKLLHYGEHTASCQIDTQTELDQFTFNGTTGDVVRIIVLRPGNDPDPRLEVRDPDGVVIIDQYCGTTHLGHCSFKVDLVLNKTGAYFMAISDQGSDGTGPYTLQIEKIPPVSTPPWIPYDLFTVEDEVNPQTDMDFFNFEGVAGTDIRITVLRPGNDPDPHLEVWGPDGNPIPEADMNCGTTHLGHCSFQADLSLSLSGTYLLAISDAGFDGTGSYQFSLSCLFGSCPSVPQSTFVDVPLGFWAYNEIDILYFAGVTVGCQPDNPLTTLNELMYCPSDDVTRAQMAVYIIRADEGDPAEDYCGDSDPFPDVVSTHWACGHIKRLLERGISSGYPDGTYKPTYTVNRAQMATYIIRTIYGDTFDYNAVQIFSDVSSNHWAFKYIQKCYEDGICGGYPDGTYKPQVIVNRAQMAVFVERAFFGP